MTDPNAKPKYAIYDEAVGALTFLDGNDGVQFSGQLNGGNYINFPDDWVGKNHLKQLELLILIQLMFS